MATVPLYLWVGSALRPGTTFTDTGVGGSFTVTALTSVSTFTYVTLGTTAHGFASFTPVKVTIAGVGGADADQINKTWEGAFWISPNQVLIDLDASALTLTASGTLATFQSTVTPFSAAWGGLTVDYDWNARIEGVNDGGTQKYRFAGAPGDDSYAPFVWNHDGPKTPPTISGITTGAVTTLTLSSPHGRTAGDQIEAQILGVTGADADQLNGTWEATFRSTNQIEVALNSSALTLTATGTVRLPFFTYFSDQVTASNAYQITTQTDRTNGGSATATFTSPRNWGVSTSLVRDLHELHGPDGERAFYLECANVAPLLGRVPRTVDSVTKGTWTRLVIPSHAVPQDTGKPFSVTLWGFSGDYAGLNGLHSAYYIDSTTIEIRSVDSSAFGTYAGGAEAVTDQRWREDYAETWTDFENRLRDAIQWIEAQGDTAECKGIVSTLGYVDIPTSKVDTLAERQSGFRVSSATTSGYPVTLTMTDAVPYSTPAAGAALRYVRLTGAGGLSGLHECRINSSTELVLHATNSTALPSGAKVEIGDPIYFASEELPTTLAAIRNEVVSHTGQTATDIPFAIVDPISLDAEQWNGVDPWTSAQIDGIWQAASAVAVDPAQRVAKVDTTGLTLLAQNQIGGYEAIQLGHRIYAKWRELVPAAPSVTTRGVPVYVMLGDSYCTGANSYLDAQQGGDARFDGTDYAAEVTAGTRRIKILNHATNALEDYGAYRIISGVPALGNSVTHPILNVRGDGTATASIIGSDQGFALDARSGHPDAEYVVLLKLGVSGATLLGGTQSYTVSSIEADPDDSDYALVTVDGGYWYYNPAGWNVTFTGVDDSGLSGISDGVSYATTLSTLTTFRIYTGGALSGTYSGGLIVNVPRWRWDKASGSIWPYLEAAWASMQSLLDADGKYPDVRGIFIPGLGLNDCLAGNTVANYQAAHTQFLADLRDLLTTRSSPSPVLPIAQSKLKTYAYNNGNATVAAAVATVNAALDANAAADSGFAVHSLDATDGNESDKDRFPIKSDEVHLTGDAVIEQGYEGWDTLQSVDQSCANVEGVSSSSGSSSIEAVS